MSVTTAMTIRRPTTSSSRLSLLPIDVLRRIYEYDPTYRDIMNEHVLPRIPFRFYRQIGSQLVLPWILQNDWWNETSDEDDYRRDDDINAYLCNYDEYHGNDNSDDDEYPRPFRSSSPPSAFTTTDDDGGDGGDDGGGDDDENEPVISVTEISPTSLFQHIQYVFRLSARRRIRLHIRILRDSITVSNARIFMAVTFYE
jgi:hypothetical protein